MKVILRQDVEKLGKMGDTVTVSDGYARNYLIPRGLAYYASEAAVQRLEEEKRQHQRQLERERISAQELSNRLQEVVLTIPMRVGEEGRLFGSVTPQMIADELQLHGFTIDRRSIIIEEPIRSLGTFEAKVRLHPEVVCTVRVWVTSAEE
ncbi:MAG: 50S ribosomal protein L9 [Candidatus Kapabacteria bacterium]|nr:50S ribosomal protein L9 [Candidatus Kapabacteria bacterium]MDW7996165.1 50S ribosomal protein L9 [Bacteroidota bacterium]MDW8224993.1 50S ribosomal protein L9 [Bacteroidota bacterium]